MCEDFATHDYAARDEFFKREVASRHPFWELYLIGKMKPLRDPQLVSDILQEFYLRVLKNWQLIPKDNEASMKASLYTILFNELCNHYRRGKAKPQSDDLKVATELPGEAFDPAAQQMVEHVRTLMQAHLSDEDQHIMHLRVEQEYTYQEIADLMDMPIDTVSTRIHRARKLLKQKLE